MEGPRKLGKEGPRMLSRVPAYSAASKGTICRKPREQPWQRRLTREVVEGCAIGCLWSAMQCITVFMWCGSLKLSTMQQSILKHFMVRCRAVKNSDAQ